MQDFTSGANSAELAVPINILNLERESYTVIRLLSRTARTKFSFGARYAQLVLQGPARGEWIDGSLNQKPVPGHTG